MYKRVRRGDKSAPTLSWVQRLKVCIRASRGLDYLHTGTGIQHRIIHRDVKTTNILLDENLAAKISDFGLSKISPANQATTFVSTHVKGTFGYLDPYYFSTRRLTRKFDVYSFGVVLFEVLCGRPAVDRTLDGEQMGLAEWAQHCFREGLLGNIIDPKIKEEVFPDCLEAFVKVAIQCLHIGPKHRPNMAEVVVALESALVLQEKSTDYSLPEVITSDDNQDDRDFSELEVESADSEKEMVVVSRGSHQEKQSSTRMTFTKRFSVFLSHAARALSGNVLGSTELQGPVTYNYKDLKSATKNFSQEYKLGAGGSGGVYKGIVKNGNIVAVKRLALRISKADCESEVRLISNVHHRNLIRLLGCGNEGPDLLLVYEYIGNGSLDSFLYGEKRGTLNWKQRFNIIFGTARGLAYLHELVHVHLVHCDIKPSHILLDDELQPKIADFGLEGLLPEDQTDLETTDLGYAAPEYALQAQLSQKVDTYSFGVVLLEIISGRPCSYHNNFEGNDEFLLEYAWNLHENDMHLRLVDETMDGMYVCVHGHLKGFQGKKQLVIFCIRPVKDFNEITYHFAECAYVHHYNTKLRVQGGGPAAGHMPTPAASMPFQGYQAPPSNQFSGVNYNAGDFGRADKMVLDFLQQPSCVAPEIGVHQDVIARSLGLPLEAVMKSLDVRSGGGRAGIFISWRIPFQVHNEWLITQHTYKQLLD